MLRQSVDGIFDEDSEKPSLVFVDFDHTLFGGNSTELFIAYSRPSAVVGALNFLVRKCIPWRLTRLHKWFRLRDYVFCRILFLLLPNNLDRWRVQGPLLFEQRRNLELESVLARTPPEAIAIITFGMEAVVKAMLRGSQWEKVDVFATSRTAPLSHFSIGKLEIVRQAFGDGVLPKSMLITDSEDDLDLLAAVGWPVLIPPYGAADHGQG